MHLSGQAALGLAALVALGLVTLTGHGHGGDRPAPPAFAPPGGTTGTAPGGQAPPASGSAGGYTFTGGVGVSGGATDAPQGGAPGQNAGPTAPPVAAPEPSSIAAFALTGLFAAGLMLRARRRWPRAA